MLQAQRDLLQVLLRAGSQFGRVSAEFVVVEDEVGRLGVGLLGFPERIGHLTDRKGPIDLRLARVFTASTPARSARAAVVGMP